MPTQKLLRIPASPTDVTVGALYEEARAHDWNLNIKVPTNLPRVNIASYNFLLQFILSWAKLAPSDAAIETYIESPSSVENYLKTDHGLLSFNLKRRILDSRKRTIDPHADHVRSLLRRRETGMERWDTAFRGRKLFLLAGPPWTRTPKSLSRIGSNETRTPPDLVDRLGRALKKRVVVGDSPLEDGIVRSLGHTIFHLHQNTGEWGCVDPEGRPEKVPLRLIRLASHTFEHTNLETDSPLFHYLFRDVALSGVALERVLELTVLDAGPTLAAHYLAANGADYRSIDRNTYWDAIAWTLKDGNSTNRSGPSPLKGRGLFLTVEEMKQLSASIVLRTGPIYAAANYATRDSTTSIQLLTDDAPFAEGTLWSVLIPLGTR